MVGISKRGCLVALLVGCAQAPASLPEPFEPVPSETSWTTLTGSATVSCEAPAERSADPLVRTVLGEGWTFEPDYHTPEWSVRWGAKGVVIGDFDGDGILDIVAPQYSEPSRLLLGVGDGSFEEAPLPAADGVHGAVGGSAADADGDGDLDIFLYCQYATPPVMLWNDGVGVFTAETRADWDDPGFLGCGGSASWADFDLDGDLDLFYGRLGLVTPDDVYTPCPSRLLENDGSGTFVDVADTWLGDDLQSTRIMASGWLPFDADPHPELYVVTDMVIAGFGSNVLYDNGPDGLTRLPIPSLDLRPAGMGLGAADLNGDAVVDLLIPDQGRLLALRSEPGAIWVNDAVSLGLVPALDEGQVTAWGGDYADLDNDGDLDLLVTYGTNPHNLGQSVLQADEIYLRDGDGYNRTAEAWGAADLDPSRGVLAVDLNRDGWLDIVKRELGGVVTVDMARCGAEEWLTVRLNDTGNTAAVGATVRLHVGDETQTRWVVAGSTSFSSGGPPEVHFGLGAADLVDRLEVVWPDGEIDSWSDVSTRQHLEITRGAAEAGYPGASGGS